MVKKYKVLNQLDFVYDSSKYSEKNSQKKLTVQGQDLDLLKFINSHSSLLRNIDIETTREDLEEIDKENDFIVDRDIDATDLYEKSQDVKMTVKEYETILKSNAEKKAFDKNREELKKELLKEINEDSKKDN